jgi:hypothetical protein
MKRKRWINKPRQVWEVDGDTASITISSKGKDYRILISVEDIPLVSSYRWCMNNCDYAITSTKPNILLHRMLMGASEINEVDHINRNPLDNRRANLRFCSRSQNLQNAPVRKKNGVNLKGVWFDKDRHKKGQKCYQAYIQVDKKRRHLGRYYSAKEAGQAYDDAAIELFGEFACTNKSLGLL